MKRLLLTATLAIAAPIAAFAAAPQIFNFETGTFEAAGQGGAAPAAASVSADSSAGLPEGIVEQVLVTTLPSVPKPGDIVSIRVDSYSTDLNKANVVWTRDGETIAEGRGVVTVSIVAPEAGKRTVIEMTAAKAEGGFVHKKITVTPTELDIVYEAETYTPPFYQGRAEFTNSSRVRLMALPKLVNPDTGREIPPEELVYTWRVNGAVDQEVSGYGRSVADVYGQLVSRGLEIEVEAEAIDAPLRARATLVIKDQQPDIAVYEDHPLYGVLFERAVDADETYPVASTEVTLLAVPYSMDIESLSDPRATFSWLTELGRGPASPTVTYRPETGATGEAAASVRVTHQNFAQYAQRAVTMLFGDTGAVASVASTTPSGSYAL